MPRDHPHHPRVGARPSRPRGKILVSPGWLAVYGKAAAVADDDEGGTPQLVAVSPGEGQHRRILLKSRTGLQAARTLQ